MKMLIELEDISVEYRQRSKMLCGLRSLTCGIESGERIALTGASGSGKSTLLSVIGGISTPTNGNYYFEGRSVLEMSSQKLAHFRGEKIGFIFQNFCLLPHLTLLQNALVPVEHLGEITDRWIERARDLLADVGIGDLYDRFPHQISGGQAQRVAIARALMRSPKVILADEPTGSLDQESAQSVMRLLNSLSEHGVAIIVATHDKEIAESLSRTISLPASTDLSRKAA